MRRAIARDLLFVSKSQKERIDLLRRGQQLVADTGYSIDALRDKAVSDRLQLANTILRSARSATNPPNASYRTAVSRAYYAMYHAFRAVSFFVNGGDDYEAHLALPKHIPNDFPMHISWENDLKDARLQRNQADYDPYPKNDLQFASMAQQLIPKAEDAIAVSRRYLRDKGWQP